MPETKKKNENLMIYFNELLLELESEKNKIKKIARMSELFESASFCKGRNFVLLTEEEKLRKK